MRPIRLMLIATLLPLGACSGTSSTLAEMGVGPGPSGKTYKAPDFVANSRKANMDFLPVGVSAPARSSRPRGKDATKELEADLRKAGQRNEAQGKAATGAGKSVGKVATQP